MHHRLKFRKTKFENRSRLVPTQYNHSIHCSLLPYVVVMRNVYIQVQCRYITCMMVCYLHGVWCITHMGCGVSPTWGVVYYHMGCGVLPTWVWFITHMGCGVLPTWCMLYYLHGVQYITTWGMMYCLHGVWYITT